MHFIYFLFSILHLISPCMALNLDTEHYYIIGGAAGGIVVLILIACCFCRTRKPKHITKVKSQKGDVRNFEPQRETQNYKMAIVNEQQPVHRTQLRQVDDLTYVESEQDRSAFTSNRSSKVVSQDYGFEPEIQQPSPPPYLRILNDLIHLELEQNIAAHSERQDIETHITEEVIEPQVQQTISRQESQDRKSNDLTHPEPVKNLYSPSQSWKSDSVTEDEFPNGQPLQADGQTPSKQPKSTNHIESTKDLYSPKKLQHTDSRRLYEKNEKIQEPPIIVAADYATDSEDLPEELHQKAKGKDGTSEFQRMPRIKNIKEGSSFIESGGPRDSLQDRRRRKGVSSASVEAVKTAEPSNDAQDASPGKRGKSKRTSNHQDVQPLPQADVNERRKRLVAEQNVQDSDSDSASSATKTERIQPRKHWKSIFNQY